MPAYRIETDSLGEVKTPSDKLWGAQTQRALEHFRIGNDPMPREMIQAYAVLKKAAALANHQCGRLSLELRDLIVQACDEMLAGDLDEHFPLGVWMSGSGTQFNMNVNEVVSNRCSQLAGMEPGSKKPVHPNDHVNMSQSTNDSFPSAMCIAAAKATKDLLIPSVDALRAALAAKADEWGDIVKVGRTHLQDATPMTLGQEFSGYAAMVGDGVVRLEQALEAVYPLTLGGTAIGTGVNAAPGFARAATASIAELSGLPFTPVRNRFAAQGAHDALVHLSAAVKTLAGSLYKIANDIRLLACGPRCGIGEFVLPSNEPGSSIMPGKVNPTQCEVLAMVAVQAMANDTAVALGGASGYLEMNVYKPLIIRNLLHSVHLLADGCRGFRVHLVEGMAPDRKRIESYVERCLMLATALNPVIGYDKASETAHYALERDLSLKEAALQLGVVSAEEFDKVADPRRMAGLDAPPDSAD